MAGGEDDETGGREGGGRESGGATQGFSEGDGAQAVAAQKGAICVQI